jgi:hypothetical protein
VSKCGANKDALLAHVNFEERYIAHAHLLGFPFAAESFSHMQGCVGFLRNDQCRRHLPFHSFLAEILDYVFHSLTCPVESL